MIPSPVFHPYIVTAYLTALITLTVGIFVYAKNRRAPIHGAFLIFSASIAQWSFFTALHAMQHNPAWSLFWGKVCHVGGMLTPIFFYYFTLKIIGKQQKTSLRIGFIAAAILIILNFATPLFLAGTRTDAGLPNFMSAGPFYFLMFLFFAAYVLLGLAALWKEIYRSTGSRKKHLGYFFSASLLGFTIGIFNFLPIYGVSIPPYPYSPLCGAIYSCIIAYAILCHKLFDIELIFKKGIIFGFLFGIVYYTVSAFIFAVGYILAKESLPVLSALSIAAAMLLYEPLKFLLTQLTNRFLFQKKTAYTSLIQTLTDKLAKIRDSQTLAEEIADFLNHHMALEWAALYLKNNGGTGFQLRSATAHTSLTKLHDDGPIISLVRSRKTPLILSPFDVESDVSPELKASLRRNKIEAMVPIFVEKTFYGILLLGKKKSDDMFSAEDEALLQTLMDEVGMFFLSAKLLKEVSKANLELGQRMKMAAVTQLAAGVHHEVRNPLQSIDFSALAILNDLKQWPKNSALPNETIQDINHYLFSILNHVNRIQNSLERFAKLARPEEDFELSTLSLKTELDKFLKLMEEGQMLDKIHVRNNIPDTIHVVGSEGILLEIFFNLFNNAYEAMNGKGELFFEAEARAEYVEIKIRNTGPQIPDNILPHIFDRYFTTKKNREALGIGLSVAKHHVERLGGTIDVSLKETNGAEFILKLLKPSAEAKAA